MEELQISDMITLYTVHGLRARSRAPQTPASTQTTHESWGIARTSLPSMVPSRLGENLPPKIVDRGVHGGGPTRGASPSSAWLSLR